MEAEEEDEHNEPTTPGTSILDRKPLRIFGHPLTTTQQMWVGFLMPAIISTIIFLANFALDIAVAYQLFRDEHPWLSGVTLAFVYAPSFVCFILTCTKLPEMDNVCELIAWIVIQFLQSLLFPVGIMFRFATCLFWSVVALTEKDPEREKGLRIVAASHQTEMFFFLDSFLNAAPQAILQAYILLSPQVPTANETGKKNLHKAAAKSLIKPAIGGLLHTIITDNLMHIFGSTAWTQAVSIITSTIALSRTTALYQRFESQRVVGRPIPWTFEQNEAHSKALVHVTQLDPYLLMGQEKPYHLKAKGLALSLVNTQAPEEHQRNETEQHEGSEVNQAQQRLHQEEQEEDPQKPSTATQGSGSSHDKTSFQNETDSPAGPSENNANQNSQMLDDADENPKEEPQEQDALMGTNTSASQLSTQSNDAQTSSDYLEPIRVETNPSVERCFWPRILTPPSSPTADPHMRPRLSINTIRSQNRPAYTPTVPLPMRMPRTKGLHEDEPLGIFAVFHAWLAYLIARVLVIAAFSHFYFWPSLGMILSHYVIMVAYLCFCSPCPNYWAPLMGLVFILCPIEVKVRYKYPRMFLISFFVLVLLEDLASVILWYCGAEWESWWYDFAFAFIIGCHGMAALNATLYLFMFKPKAKYAD